MTKRNHPPQAAEDPESLLVTVRGQRVMLAHDIAALYEVPTKVLNQAVERNRLRFPDDFMFVLTGAEVDEILRATKDERRRAALRFSHRNKAFTEHGIAMLSSVLKSPRAIRMSIAIIRIFIRVRREALTHKDLRRQLKALERKTDRRFRDVFRAIRALMTPTDDAKSPIGFSAR